MDHDWQPARLIPTSGISGPEEQETRATSALLAVLPVVRPFANALLKPIGAPAGTIEPFIEVPFETSDGRTVRPDGLIRVTRGKKAWTALVEVKTGTNELGREQVENYLDVARDSGFDAVLTISNQISAASGVHPVDVDKRKIKRVELHHLSWAEVLSTAVVERVHRGVSDPEQAWILAELIGYLEHPRSGALDFTDMGPAWVGVRESVLAGTLRANDRGAVDVASRWDQLLRFAALRLERELGTGVHVNLSRREVSEPSIRVSNLVAELVNTGSLSGAIRVPNAVGDLQIIADIRTGRCTVATEVAAPAEGRPLTRVNWLVRQLSESHEALRVDAFAHMARHSTSALLKAIRSDPTVLLPDGRGELRRFGLSATSQLGTKRTAGRGSVIDTVIGAIEGFYETVLQDIRPWIAKAPQLPRSGSAVSAAGIDTTVLPNERESPEPPEDPDGTAISDEVASDAAVAHEQTPTPTLDPESSAAQPLISWADQERELREEREVGLPASNEIDT